MAKTLSKEEQEIHRKSTDDKIYIGELNVFPVEKILDIRAITTEVEYLVKWKGYSAKHNEWVAEKDVTNDLKRAFSLKYLAKGNLRHQIVKQPSTTKKDDEEVHDVQFDESTEAVEKFTLLSTKCELSMSMQEVNSDHQNNEGDSTLELYMPPIDSINETMRKLSNEIENNFESDESILLKVESANVSQLSDEDEQVLLGYDEFMQAVFQ